MTLLGIAARLHALTIDLDHALRGTWSSIHQLLRDTDVGTFASSTLVYLLLAVFTSILPMSPS